MKWWFKLSMVLLAVMILYISLTRAGLEIVNREEKMDNLRNVPILYIEKNKDGELRECSYKLPETKTLPDSPLYFIKKIRDELWINFTYNQLDKARITLLIADKRIEEAIKLNQKINNEKLINKTVMEAIKKIESAEQILSKLDQNEIEVNKILFKIYEAKKAYVAIFDLLKIDESMQFQFKEIERYDNEKEI